MASVFKQIEIEHDNMHAAGQRQASSNSSPNTALPAWKRELAAFAPATSSLTKSNDDDLSDQWQLFTSAFFASSAEHELTCFALTGEDVTVNRNAEITIKPPGGLHEIYSLIASPQMAGTLLDDDDDDLEPDSLVFGAVGASNNSLLIVSMAVAPQAVSFIRTPRRDDSSRAHRKAFNCFATKPAEDLFDAFFESLK